MNFKIWQNKYNYPLGNNYCRDLLLKSTTFWFPGHCLKNVILLTLLTGLDYFITQTNTTKQSLSYRIHLVYSYKVTYTFNKLAFETGVYYIALVSLELPM